MDSPILNPLRKEPSEFLQTRVSKFFLNKFSVGIFLNVMTCLGHNQHVNNFQTPQRNFMSQNMLNLHIQNIQNQYHHNRMAGTYYPIQYQSSQQPGAPLFSFSENSSLPTFNITEEEMYSWAGNNIN
jgi:hypothetical protein